MRMLMMGLGKMGANMARRLCRGGIEVVGYNRSPQIVNRLVAEEGLIPAGSLSEAVEKLTAPRVVWLMLPAGEATEQTIHDLIPLLEEGDVVVDGGNSNYHQSERRGKLLADHGIGFMDAGTSGGVWGLANGYCLMVGGEAGVVELVAPALKVLAPAPDCGWAHVGPIGAGHFTKMVHNGIEYGMMQAYAEGFEIMEASRFGPELDFGAIAHLWNQGSVVRSWLLELAEEAFHKNARIDDLSGHVDDSGEGRWTVQQALETGVPAEVITLSLMRRFRSRQKDPFAERVLSALRREFGGHAVVKSGK
ncbi:MAG: decarboxylating 6-phosphogluconate dehydrogenase [Gammaproteobacteria bacterium]